MRIAVISTPFVRVPPQGYGGTELFCGHLAEALVARGHDVTLFATGDSEFSGETRSCFPGAVWPPSDAAELEHCRFALEQIARDPRRYDGVQLNSPVGLEVARELGVEVVYTMHHRREEELSALYAAHGEAHYVAISHRQLELETHLRHASVVHHGVAVGDYPPSSHHESYVLHLGRFAPEKGTHLAIDAAVQAKVPIVVAGRVHEKDDDAQYFDREVMPRMTLPRVEFVGEADRTQKLEHLRSAMALLCPIEWEEPFGLIAIEAMLTGTPVIGFPRGAFPEIIDEGVTGMLVSNVDEMSRAIERAPRWNRAACARRARLRFSSERMAMDYEAVFQSVLRRQSSPGLIHGRDVPRSTSLG
ncbi:MAG TPA: glycosyltransferase family 4 protein [Polyangiaceae bacterium]|nr:glycosyltransferase family 4 protein [Polyangiaceae bacterium]